MSRVSQFSAWIYERMLILYPEDLRRAFGNEMVLAFSADLEACGAVLVWRCALGELFTVALPGQGGNPFVLSPVLAFLITALTQGTLAWLGTHQRSYVSSSEGLAVTWLAVFLASTMNALVAFVVTCFYSRSAVNVLRLD